MSEATTPTTKIYDTLYFICRAQPFTNGHKHNIDQGLALAHRVVVILGSTNRARDTRNPFTFNERVQFIQSVYPNETASGAIDFAAQRDYPYQDTMWVSYIQKIVHSKQYGRFCTGKIGIIGHMKDDTYYLKLFPQWDFVPVDSLGDDSEMNATAVRQAYFEDMPKLVEEMLPPSVARAMHDFKYGVSNSEAWCTLRDEHFHLKKYRAAWKNAPYAPTFVTVDAVVIQSGHILLVKRRSAPGKGLLALPGGFLNPNERIVDAMVRELYEETKLNVPKPVIYGSIAGSKVYDHPTRSQRGRTITHAYMVQLKNGKLPKVKGSDDAVKAFWVPLSEIYTKQDSFFEDHFFVIEDMVQRYVESGAT